MKYNLANHYIQGDGGREGGGGGGVGASASPELSNFFATNMVRIRK